MYTYKAKVTRVIDGDTFEAEVDVGFSIDVTTKFRLRGIDTPETHRPKSKAEKAHGLEAKKFVKDLIEGKEIVITTHKTGKYGRYIADVKLPESFLDLVQLLKTEGFEKKESYND